MVSTESHRESVQPGFMFYFVFMFSPLCIPHRLYSVAVQYTQYNIMRAVTFYLSVILSHSLFITAVSLLTVVLYECNNETTVTLGYICKTHNILLAYIDIGTHY